MTDTVHRPAGAGEVGKECAICQTSVAAGDLLTDCPECAAPYHVECWRENGGCAIYGCAMVPETVGAQPPAPQSFWGQEDKICPQCDATIKAAALRCRYCGAVFKHRDPVSRAAFQRQRAGPPVAAAWILFLGGLFPLTAPLTLAVGGPWFLISRERVRTLPGTLRVMALVGMLAALLSSASVAVGFLIYALGGAGG